MVDSGRKGSRFIVGQNETCVNKESRDNRKQKDAE